MSINGSKKVIDGLIHQEFRKVVVCGSFQQHLKYIEDVIAVLHKHNITVLSPWTTKIVPETSGTDFILLEGQEPLKNKRDTWTHRYRHMDKFRQSDVIIVCNPNGYVGKGAMFELGFIVASSKRIIFTEKPSDDLSVPFPYEVGLNF
jgi:nucleoside 2-deoxyribosyltransferase